MIICPDDIIVEQNGSYKWSQKTAAQAWTATYIRLGRYINRKTSVVMMCGISNSGKSTYASLLKFSPLGKNLWGCGVVTSDMVHAALEANRLNPNCYSEAIFNLSRRSWSPEDHAERIAYLIVNESEVPIHVDVGLENPTGIRHPIIDGNHRLSAAILRGDEVILAYVSGAERVIEEMKLVGRR